MKTFAFAALTLTAAIYCANAQPSPQPFTISAGWWSDVTTTKSNAGQTVEKSAWCVQKPVGVTRPIAATLDNDPAGDCATTDFNQSADAVHLTLSCHNAAKGRWTIVAEIEMDGWQRLLVREHKQHLSNPMAPPEDVSRILTWTAAACPPTPPVP